ncbi:MAG: hypothetical protein ACFFAS_03360 [Promethearchaeota archaeon]
MKLNIYESLKKKWYLIIPLCCLCFWAFIALLKDRFEITPAIDFPTLYYSAQYIFTRPEQIYFIFPYPYPYTTFFACIFSPIILIFTMEQAHWFYFFLIITLTMFCVYFFDQILDTKGISNRFHKFLILMCISNGLIFMRMYDILNTSIFSAFGLLWFLKREIKYRELGKNLEDTKFIFTQMVLLIFSIGMAPQYAFLALIYLFHNIKINEIFSRIQIKKYLLLIAAFFLLNFMMVYIFFVSPEAIANFFGGSYRGGGSLYRTPETNDYDYYLSNKVFEDIAGIRLFFNILSLFIDLSGISISIMTISIILITSATFFILSTRYSIEKKFGLWALSALLMYSFLKPRYFVSILPMVALLFIDKNIFESKKLFEFLKRNYLYIVGLGSILLLYFMPPIDLIIRIFPFLIIIPIELMYFRWILIYLILFSTAFLLYRRNTLLAGKNFNFEYIKKDFNFRIRSKKS